MGTRFLATVESGAHPDYVAALLSATANDTVHATVFGEGWPDAPHRVLRLATERAAAWPGRVVGRCAYGDQHWDVDRWSPQPPTVFTTGEVAAMAMYAGCGVGDITDVPPAAEIVDRLIAEAVPLLAGITGAGSQWRTLADPETRVEHLTGDPFDLRSSPGTLRASPLPPLWP